jgi:hypothetical protein
LILGCGAVLSALAGLMAFLISYDEALHRFASRRARREGFSTACSAFVFFAVITVILAFVI